MASTAELTTGESLSDKEKSEPVTVIRVACGARPYSPIAHAIKAAGVMWCVHAEPPAWGSTWRS